MACVLRDSEAGVLMPWSNVLQLRTYAFAFAICGCSHPDAVHDDAGHSDDASPDAAPMPSFETATWMLSSIQRTPDLGATCYNTLVHLDVAIDHLQLGERRIECGTMTESVSAFAFTLAGETVQLGGQPVGALTGKVLDVTLPAGAGSLHIDLGGTTATYQESETALGATTAFAATVTQMPDDRPIALAIAVAGTEDIALNGRLRVARLPDDVVTFAVSTPPSIGTVTSFDGASGDFAYRSNTNANGADAIGFTVSDGVNPTTSAAVAIQLAAVEDAPIVTSQSLSIIEDTSTPLALNASDPDNDPLTFTIVSQPAHGTVAVAGTTVTFSPAHDYNGSDSFTYRVSDGQLSSGVASVQITVTPVNDPPVATAAAVSTRGTNRVPITLAATDVDSTSLTYALATQPSHGTLTGTPPSVIYRANAGYVGDDTFTFTANDGMATSAPGTITVHVLAPVYATANVGTGFITTVLATPSVLYFAGTGNGVYATDASATAHLVFTPTAAYADAFSMGKAFTIAAGDFVAYGYSPGSVDLRALATGALIKTITNPDPTVYTTGEVTIGRPSIAGATAYLLVSWASATQHIAEVWSTDGTAAGTARLYQLGAIAGTYRGLWEVGAKQVFFAGLNLMTMTGSTSAPSVLASLPAGATVIWGLPAAGVVFFEVDQITGCTNFCDPARELYRTNGTAAGSSVIATVDASFISWGAYEATDYNGHLYYAHDRSLYAADPIATGVTLVAQLPTNGWSGTSLSFLTAVNGKLFFGNRDENYPVSWQTEAYLSSGVGTSASLLSTWPQGSYMTNASMAFDGLTVFPLYDARLGQGLWGTDYTAMGTQLELDLAVQTLLGVVNGRLLAASNGTIVAIYRP
ncbi:MAG: family of calcium-binding protein [Myxococcales bacterium]|nr:family of calcium-binding protein [Myxococcales bacterium]